VLAGDGEIRAAAVQRQVAGAGGQQREARGREGVLDVGRHLAGQQLRRVPSVVGQPLFDARPVGLAEGGEPDPYPVLRSN
jgi:hypothetical protein